MKFTRRLATLASLLTLSLTSAMSTLAQPTNDLPALLPPYAELPPTFWEQHGLTLVLGSVAAVLVAGAVVWLILRPRPTPVLPPEVQARRALEALRSQPETGALLSQVSQILRRYYVAAFENRPAELTTSEIETLVVTETRVDAATGAALLSFLRRSDQLKFGPSDAGDSIQAVSHGLELLQQLQVCRQIARHQQEVLP